MKKIFLIGGVLVLMLAILLLCFPSLQNDTDIKVYQQADQHADYHLRFGHNVPIDSAMHQAALRYAQAVEDKTQGKVRISVYPAQQLGNDHQMVEMARAGDLDMILTPTAKLSVPVPAMQYADLPFLFPSRQDAYDLLDGEPGQMLLKKLREIDLVGVTFWENGFKHFTGNKPLLTPEDFVGLNIRTMKSRIIMDQFKAFGAHPIPIDFYATRQALVDGVVDGEENPLIAIVSMGFHEVQTDLTLSEHAYLSYVLSFSAKVLEALPQNIQEVLLTTALEITPWERQETQRREVDLIEKIRQAGVRIHTLSPENRCQFAENTKHIVDKFEAVIGADIMSKTSELLMEKYASQSENTPPIIIGIDAGLALESKVSGLAIKRGVMLAIEDINAKGGVLGRQLVLLTRNHNGIPSMGIANIEKFAEDPSVVAVIGGQHGSVVRAELETVHSKEIPMLLPWSSVTKAVDNGLQPNYVFRVSANDRFVAPFMMDQVIKRYKRPAIFYENTVWGRGNLELMGQRLRDKGVKFVYSEAVNRGRKAFSQSVDKALSEGADVIVMVVKSLEGHFLVKTIAQRANPLPVIAHWGIVGGEFWEMSHQDLERVDLKVFQTFRFIDNHHSNAVNLAKRYIDRFGEDSVRNIQAPAGVAQAYDLVQLLALAIKEAGSTERSAVRDAMEKLPVYQGVVKRYAPAFTKTRHDALNTQDYQMMKFANDGALVSE